MTHKELLTAIDDFRQALALARAVAEHLTGPTAARHSMREAVDLIGARGAALIEVATGAVKVEA
jgi:hypothetical protein